MTDNSTPTLVEKPIQTRRAPGPWKLDDIVDGRALRVKLTAAAHQHVSDEQAMRKAALDLLHAAMFRGRMIAQDAASLRCYG